MVLIRQPISEDKGIHIFDPEIMYNHQNYNAEGLESLHAAENTYFWFIARKERILAIFQKYISKDEKIIEIGAGTGCVSKRLIDDGYNVSVGEIHLNGLRYAYQNGIKKCYQFDLFNPPFADHFNVVGMFDVLEHLENDLNALKQVKKILKKNGKIILTVPALNLLWTRDDAYSHKRRYNIKEIKKVLTKSGFVVLYARYFFISILPLLIIRRILHPDDGRPIQPHEYDRELKFKIHPILNRFLTILTCFENRLSKMIPNLPGGSIIIVGGKVDK